MKMELNNNGYWEINRGKTKIGRAVKQLYTEEQLFEYFFSIAE